MEKTGFNAFWIYQTLTKMHLKKGKFDITQRKLPQRDKWVTMWNDKRKNMDGVYFYKLEQKIKYKKEFFVRCLAYYWLKDPNYYIANIFKDELQTFYDYEEELRSLQEKVEYDFTKVLKYCAFSNIDLKDMFISKTGLPKIILFYQAGKISIHSLIAFEKTFNILSRVNRDALNIVDQNKFDYYEIIFDKYYKIVYKFYTVFECKKIFKNIIKQIKNTN